MNRRKFLTGTAAGAAAVAAFGIGGGAQVPTAPAGGQAPAAGRGRGAAPIGNPGTPAMVPASKLARISLMQLNFNALLIPQPSANNPNPTPNANQTLTIFDLPKVYVENYGVHNIEFQHGNIIKVETDPNYIKELKAKLDEYKMTMTQVNLEIGAVESMSGADPAGRAKGIAHIKQWIDICSQLGCKRIMLNQQQAQLIKERRADAVAFMKEAADAGRPKGVMISVETRGAAQPSEMVNGAPVVRDLGMKPWEFMIGIIKDAGANSNVDIGNVGANNQQELHDCIKAWYPYSSGNMHIKSSPFWDIGAAVRFTEGLGYKGNYAIEVGAHAGQRMVYNQILANIA
jgi:sugar phosphate isomerase/epimerase